MKDPWIETYTGKRFELRDPRPEMVDLEDIAHSLARLCRYTGHVQGFYSVARHSILAHRIACSRGLTPDECRLALFHDAHEAYIGDLASPYKWSLDEVAPGALKILEHGIEQTVHDALQLHGIPKEKVKQIDLELLEAESRVLYGRPRRDDWFGKRGWQWKAGDDVVRALDAVRHRPFDLAGDAAVFLGLARKVQRDVE
jgi:hypothetical protein